jgi:hypothetical protein
LTVMASGGRLSCLFVILLSSAAMRGLRTTN